MSENRLSYLYYRHIDGTITTAEKEEFNSLLAHPDNEAALKTLMEESWATFPASKPIFNAEESNRIWQAVLPQRATPRIPATRTVRYWWAAAAAVLISASTWFLINKSIRTPATQTQANAIILPGSNKATLTLGDGRTITLDSTTQSLSDVNGVKIFNFSGGTLSYQDQASGNNSSAISYNTLSTPRGGQYQLVLPDGSKVWLNAASSIRFPSAFNERERKVTVTGEAYFEVAANSQSPFFVDTRAVVLQVLGTSFNINTYENEEAEKLALASGSVRITSKKDTKHTVLLTPGMQAVASDQQLATQPADIAKIISWKNGVFTLDNASLPEVMRQLERWYDIQVVFEGPVPGVKIGGKIDRGVTLNEMLESLTEMEIKYRMQNRTLTILK